MTLFLIALAFLIVARLVFGLCRFFFELGCRYQAASSFPEYAHTSDSFRHAVEWATTQREYLRTWPVSRLIFGR